MPHAVLRQRKEFSVEERFKRAMTDRGLEWFSALVMVWWGIALAAPGDTLSGPNFVAFHRYEWMTEAFWAWTFGVLGGIRVVALFINGSATNVTPWFRLVGSFFGLVSWAQIAYLFYLGNAAAGTVGTGVGTYGLLALADLLSVFRAAHDARYYNS